MCAEDVYESDNSAGRAGNPCALSWSWISGVWSVVVENAGTGGSEGGLLDGAVFSLLVFADDCDKAPAFSNVSEKAGGCAEDKLDGGEAAITSGSIKVGGGAGCDGGMGKSWCTICTTRQY